MSSNSLSLASLISSRICHDLINPIGAINNGLELLALVGQTQGPEMTLISKSVENASARVRFFRVSYGFATGEQWLGAEEINSILSGLLPTARFTLDWGPEEDVPRREVQMIFLAIQCLETAMPGKGAISVTPLPDGWQICGTSERLNMDHALWENLGDANTLPDVIPSQVHFAVLPLLLAERGRTLEMHQEENRITLCILGTSANS